MSEPYFGCRNHGDFLQSGSVKQIFFVIQVRVGGLCITSGDFSRWLTELYCDFLYADRLTSWQNQGVLTDLQVAFSRLTDKKVYVQGLMQENAQALWRSLSHPRCHYYVCGDAKMTDDVFEVFMAIANTEGNLSHIEAVEFFDNNEARTAFPY